MRWVLGRMGSSCAYRLFFWFSLVSLSSEINLDCLRSAADEISGEPVAIKMVTRVFEKVQLAKRALREITLLRHFSHENITGLIDVDCSPNLDEM